MMRMGARLLLAGLLAVQAQEGCAAPENYVVQFRAYDGINYSALTHRTVKH